MNAAFVFLPVFYFLFNLAGAQMTEPQRQGLFISGKDALEYKNEVFNPDSFNEQTKRITANLEEWIVALEESGAPVSFITDTKRLSESVKEERILFRSFLTRIKEIQGLDLSQEEKDRKIIIAFTFLKRVRKKVNGIADDIRKETDGLLNETIFGIPSYGFFNFFTGSRDTLEAWLAYLEKPDSQIKLQATMEIVPKKTQEEELREEESAMKILPPSPPKSVLVPNKKAGEAIMTNPSVREEASGITNEELDEMIRENTVKMKEEALCKQLEKLEDDIGIPESRREGDIEKRVSALEKEIEILPKVNLGEGLEERMKALDIMMRSFYATLGGLGPEGKTLWVEISPSLRREIIDAGGSASPVDSVGYGVLLVYEVKHGPVLRWGWQDDISEDIEWADKGTPLP